MKLLFLQKSDFVQERSFSDSKTKLPTASWLVVALIDFKQLFLKSMKIFKLDPLR